MTETRTIEYTFSVSDGAGSRRVTIERDDEEMTDPVDVPSNAELDVTVTVNVEYRDNGIVAFVDDNLDM